MVGSRVVEERGVMRVGCWILFLLDIIPKVILQRSKKNASRARRLLSVQRSAYMSILVFSSGLLNTSALPRHLAGGIHYY